MAADLPALDAEDQHRVGVAVGQRALSGTFNVRIEGVDACAASDDVRGWPRGYRLGVLEGVLISAHGYFQPTPTSLGTAARILAPLPDVTEVLTELLEVLEPAALAPELLANPAARAELVAATHEWERLLPVPARGAWAKLRARLQPRP